MHPFVDSLLFEFIQRYGFGSIFAQCQIVEAAREEVYYAAVSYEGLRLMLNVSALQQLDSLSRRYIIAHELGHILHGHVKPLAVLYNYPVPKTDPLWDFAAETVADVTAYCGFNLPWLQFSKTYREWLNDNVDCLTAEVYQKLRKSYQQWKEKRQGRLAEGEDNSVSAFLELFGRSASPNDIILAGQGDRAVWNVQQMCETITEAINTGYLPGSTAGLRRLCVQHKQLLVLPWRSVLMNWISSAVMVDYDWLRYSKRFLSRRMYLPELGGQYLRVLIAVDGSGSVDDALFNKFLSAIRSIALLVDVVDITLLVVSTHITDVKHYTKGDLLYMTFHLHRDFGGTHFDEIWSYALEHNFDHIIIVTDGMCEFDPKQMQQFDVLWVLASKQQTAINKSIPTQRCLYVESGA